MYRLNEYGREQLIDFISTHHIRALDILTNTSLFDYWVKDTEETYNLAYGHCPAICVEEDESKSGDEVICEILDSWMTKIGQFQVKRSGKIRDW